MMRDDKMKMMNNDENDHMGYWSNVIKWDLCIETVT